MRIKVDLKWGPYAYLEGTGPEVMSDLLKYLTGLEVGSEVTLTIEEVDEPCTE